MPEPCKFPSLNSCQKGFLWTHKGVDLAPHPIVGLMLQTGDAETFLRVIGFEGLDPNSVATWRHTGLTKTGGCADKYPRLSVRRMCDRCRSNCCPNNIAYSYCPITCYKLSSHSSSQGGNRPCGLGHISQQALRGVFREIFPG